MTDEDPNEKKSAMDAYVRAIGRAREEAFRGGLSCLDVAAVLDIEQKAVLRSPPKADGQQPAQHPGRKGFERARRRTFEDDPQHDQVHQFRRTRGRGRSR